MTTHPTPSPHSTTSTPRADTRTGRLLQASAVAISTALPDYLPSLTGRFLINCGLLTGISYLLYDITDADTRAQLRELTTHLRTEKPTHLPAATWVVLAVVLALMVGSSVVSVRLQRRMVRWLARRGVARPNTLLGIVAGVITYLSSNPQMRPVGVDKHHR